MFNKNLFIVLLCLLSLHCSSDKSLLVDDNLGYLNSELNFKGDITNKKQVYNWIKKNKFDIFIHLAAIVPVTEVNKNYNYAKKVNFLGTKYILDALIKYQNMNLKWFFFPSTSHVYKFNKRKKLKKIAN